MAKFRKYYEKRERSYSCGGNKYEYEYQLYIDSTGEECLKVVGETDVQAAIDSHADSVNLDLILQRCADTGDNSYLDKVKGFYADISDLPVNLVDIMNLNLRGKSVFDEMPSEYKALYGDSYNAFIANPELLFDYMQEKNVDDMTIGDEVNADDDEE